jgi:type IV pilus assembly protein PilV
MRSVMSAGRSEGFTLLEALVALVILAILLLGLLAGLLGAIHYNLLNYMRDEARLIALECAENIRNIPFTNLVSGRVDCWTDNVLRVGSPCTDVGLRIANSQAEEVRRQVRNASVTYRLGWTVDVGGDVAQIQIRVCWTYRNTDYTHTVTTVVGRSTGGS